MTKRSFTLNPHAARHAGAVQAHDKAGDNRQGERYFDLHCAAAGSSLDAGPVKEIDSAPDFFDVSPDDVHADAASGDAGDLLHRRETGQEDQAQGLPFAHGGGLLGANQPSFHRLTLDPFGIDARAVVGDLDDDVAALVIGPQQDRAGGLLAFTHSHFGLLDAVVAGVADDVSERVLDRLDDGLVELGFGALHLDLDLLADLGGEIADYARQLVPDHPDGLHTGAHDAFLKFAGDQVEALRGTVAGAVLAGRPLQDLIAGQHQFPDQVHQLVEQGNIDPDGRPCGGAVDGFGCGGGAGLSGDLRLGIDARLAHIKCRRRLKVLLIRTMGGVGIRTMGGVGLNGLRGRGGRFSECVRGHKGDAGRVGESWLSEL